MDVRPETARKGAGSGAAMKWPLIGSAAGHVALLALILIFLRAAAGPGAAGPVQVVLVEGDRAGGAAAEEPVDGLSIAAPQIRRSRTAPVSPPGSNPETEAPLQLPALISPAMSSASPGKGGVSGGAEGKVKGEAESRTEGAVAGAGSGAGGPGETAAASSRFGGATDVSAYARRIPGITGAGEGHEVRLLRDRIESRIVYPEEAIRRGQEGEVILRIRVGEGGLPREIRIARSSGTRLLDEAARNGVTRAAPLPSSPGWFEVPVRFFLR